LKPSLGDRFDPIAAGVFEEFRDVIVRILSGGDEVNHG
jgi:hypothetical protein